jgi:hypothetical protein
MEDNFKKANGRRPKKIKIEDNLKEIEDKGINQNQPNWL